MILQEKNLVVHPLGVPGLTIGLLGGSFDPPHEGHVHITKQAIKAFNLSKIWWLVSPGNPLKGWEPEKISKRSKECKKIMRHPAVTITNIESSLGSRFTAETIYKLQRIYPQVRFVWLMGADNLVNFHHWDKWNWIVKNVPIGVLARPGEQIKAGLSPTATRYRRFRIRPDEAFKLSTLTPPVWTLLIGPMRNVSSTDLRAKGFWP